MAKFVETISIALIVSVAICSASPARLEKLKPSKSKFLARQEVAEDIPAAQTPYPPAGIRPEIPFNLPTDEKLVAPANYYLPPLEGEPAKFYLPPSQVYGAPDQASGPPAQTYGPPEISVKDEVEEIAKDQPVEPQEQQPEESQPDDVQTDEVQPEPSEKAEPSQQSEENQQEDNNVEAEPEQIASVEEVAVEEELNNRLPQRIVLAKNNGKKSAKLKSAKLQLLPAAPLRRQVVAAQPIYLVGGSLYAYNGQLFRI